MLAELDVWDSINKMGYIDFKKLGIKKKSFFKIKEHIQKLKETLYGIVEMTHNDDREAIVKSCLCGLVSHIYVRNYDRYRSDDGTEVQLDRNSCLSSYSQLIVGIPKTIEFKNRYGWTDSLNLVCFASKIDVNTLFELAPNSIIKETSLRYSRSMDAVEITTRRSFAGIVVDTEIKYDKTHPEYAELKAKYEEELRYCSSPITHNSANRQEVVVIDGRQFAVHYSFFDKEGVVYIDNETLFTTNVKEVILDSGKKVHFCSKTLIGRKETNILALKNAVEMNRINRIRERTRQEYEALRINSIYDVITNASRIGKIQLTMNNGGYGDMPILAYGYIVLKKNTVTFKLGDNEELANSNTLEALQFMLNNKKLLSYVR